MAYKTKILLGKDTHDAPIHVYPLYDELEHDLIGTTCWCKPRVEEYATLLVVHNSFDGREYFEDKEEI